MIFMPTDNATKRVTYRWEAEQLEGVTTTNGLEGITQHWERAYSGDVDRHYVFALPKNTEQIRRVAYDDQRLSSTSVRELDETQDGWFKRFGEPNWWTMGLGRNRTIELFEVDVTYTQSYDLKGHEEGMPRYLSGSRTYATSVGVDAPDNSYAFSTDGESDHLTAGSTPSLSGMGWRFTKDVVSTYHCTQSWEVDHLNGDTLSTGATVGTYSWENAYGASEVTFSTGTIRGVTSTARQYLPVPHTTGQLIVNGIVRDFKSTVESLSVLESIVPLFNLGETDIADMIPDQMTKYIRYYALSKALGRIGEGYNKELSDHYMLRFNHGVSFLKRLQDVTQRDRNYQTQPRTELRRRPPRVRLPSEYPSVR